MSGIPGSSYTVLAVYLLMTAAACFLIGGIPPMVVLLAGLCMTIRRSDFRHLRNAGHFISWFYGVVAIVSLMVAISHVAALSSPGLQTLTTVEHQSFLRLFGMAAILSAFGWAMTKHALMPAFLPFGRVIADHGFWGNRNREGVAPQNRLAAELAKWNDMRKEGEDEANAGRASRAA
ncbi:hypothetical protein [Pseudogemmobacter bohemicus]|uniref:hypothetical protein n=1 Tax=Pseudogemmobacter bohemicus TaxID=2250708 RepID=UPI000DD2C954|nr:hypothetical protein [Pseudogemmobacter bohemicus]